MTAFAMYFRRTWTIPLILLCALLISLCGCDTPDGRKSGADNTSDPSSVNGGPGSKTNGLSPELLPEGGIYRSETEIVLSLPENAPAGAFIAYTENGDEPEADSDKYARPIVASESKVIRAALFSAKGEQLGQIVTGTYIISADIDIRVVALAVDNADLYSKETGILANRSGSGSEWERPASVEIYEPDGKLMLRQDAGIRLAGSGSRSFDPASLRIIARKPDEFDETGLKYGGSGKFHADLFGDGFTEYDRFLLRNGGNDSPHQARENFLRMNLLRDCIANEYCLGLSERTGISVFAQRCVPVCVYLNGEYYGMAVMKEDFDERLIAERYGLDKEKITVIKGKKLYYQVEAGAQAELDSWLGLCEYAIDNALAPDYAAAYEYLAGQIDIDNAAAYLASMLYLCNTDWPQNNAMVWRYTGGGPDVSATAFSDGKWRFVIRDMDLCFALHDEPSRVSKTTYSMADTDTFYRLLVFYREGKGYDFDSSTGLYGDDMKLQGLFDFLLRSEEFRTEFTHFCDVLCSREEAGYITETALFYKSLAENEIKRHIELWKSRGEIYAAYTFSHWEKSFNDISEFAAERAEYFRKYLEETLRYYA